MPKDRKTTEPGGCECNECGAIFIGGPADELCAECFELFDQYGNPVSGDRLINCCFPDCGCDGARLCMAENGASSGACAMNIERGSLRHNAELCGARRASEPTPGSAAD